VSLDARQIEPIAGGRFSDLAARRRGYATTVALRKRLRRYARSKNAGQDSVRFAFRFLRQAARTAMPAMGIANKRSSNIPLPPSGAKPNSRSMKSMFVP